VTRLRLAFFGTPEFAVPSLRALYASAHTVVGVVTQPDRPRGRGQRVSESPVKQAALAARTPVLQPDRLKDEAFLAALRGWHADLGVVAAYGKILPASVLATPPLGLINVHASLLPRYRGAAPVHRAVINGEAETGVSLMQVVQALDAGPVFDIVRSTIGPNDTSTGVEADLAQLGAALLVSVTDQIANGTARAVPQDDSLATYAPRLEKHEGVIDWAQDAAAVHNRVRGLQPWPMASSWLGNQRLILVQAVVRDANETGGSPPGAVLAASRDALSVQTGRGIIDILRVQPEGRRPMAVREYLAGHPVDAGMVFRAPA
jgi:methionyl-tRNA formyltransferase